MKAVADGLCVSRSWILILISHGHITLNMTPESQASKDGHIQTAPAFTSASHDGQDNQEGRSSPQMPVKKRKVPSDLRQNLFMIFITMTQLVQMIPLGVGINSGLALGAALGAARIDSVWIVASYPLTQGAFVLIGESETLRMKCKCDQRFTKGLRLLQEAGWERYWVIRLC